MKLRIEAAGQTAFYYPDLLLSCDPDDRETYFRRRPCLIVEVLSEATERIDRREKLYAYTQIPSLQEYVLCPNPAWKPNCTGGSPAAGRRCDSTPEPSLSAALESWCRSTPSTRTCRYPRWTHRADRRSVSRGNTERGTSIRPLIGQGAGLLQV